MIDPALWNDSLDKEQKTPSFLHSGRSVEQFYFRGYLEEHKPFGADLACVLFLSGVLVLSC